MAQLYHHTAAPTPSRSLSTESSIEMDYDEDVLRHNKNLKERRDRLLQELMRLEEQNKHHCDNLRDILKPLEMMPRLRTKSYFHDHDEYESEHEDDFKSNALEGNEEFAIPTIDDNMNEEQKKDFLSLLVRYLCLANKVQRHELKALYSKQTSLYFQAQGLRLEEQREFLNTLSMPYPAFQPLDQQNITEIQSLLAKFPGFVLIENLKFRWSLCRKQSITFNLIYFQCFNVSELVAMH